MCYPLLLRTIQGYKTIPRQRPEPRPLRTKRSTPNPRPNPMQNQTMPNRSPTPNRRNTYILHRPKTMFLKTTYLTRQHYSTRLSIHIQTVCNTFPTSAVPDKLISKLLRSTSAHVHHQGNDHQASARPTTTPQPKRAPK